MSFIIYTPPVLVIKSRSMRWVGHMTSMEEVRNAYKILVGTLKG
jgi:hypothetical protein